ncbi:ComEC/Rec2 family competence protein [Arthrobacter terricola]|uniref:ComEC/Rec2 family competence protein n=1 Tax=Arthrobacter terricola TaxID=2547396 RepID=UPI001F35462D|nr:ComEC/Rec2 family competence protein [Arthrobacter terricola]
MGGDAAGLMPGMVTGDTSRLDEGLETAMKTTGTTHLTAVSGENLSHMQEPNIFFRAPGTECNSSEYVSREATPKEINCVQDSASLTGKYVKVFHGGQLVREGRVETISHDSRMIWLESFGTDPRRLFDLAEGYEVRVRLD